MFLSRIGSKINSSWSIPLSDIVPLAPYTHMRADVKKLALKSVIQSNLRREDTLGQRPLSSLRRLSSSRRLSNICLVNPPIILQTIVCDFLYSICMNQGEGCGDVDKK